MSRIKRRNIIIGTESLLLQLGKFKHTQVLSTTRIQDTAEIDRKDTTIHY